jgi:hypothetical protein
MDTNCIIGIEKAEAEMCALRFAVSGFGAVIRKCPQFHSALFEEM